MHYLPRLLSSVHISTARESKHISTPNSISKSTASSREAGEGAELSSFKKDYHKSPPKDILRRNSQEFFVQGITVRTSISRMSVSAPHEPQPEDRMSLEEERVQPWQAK